MRITILCHLMACGGGSTVIQVILSNGARRKLCTGCKANDWLILYYNPISLLSVMVWSASARSSLFFLFLIAIYFLTCIGWVFHNERRAFLLRSNRLLRCFYYAVRSGYNLALASMSQKEHWCRGPLLSIFRLTSRFGTDQPNDAGAGEDCLGEYIGLGINDFPCEFVGISFKQLKDWCMSEYIK